MVKGTMGRFSEHVLASPIRLALPILTFPGARLVGCTVKDMVTNAAKQVEAQFAIHRKFNTRALLSAMDLSAEAEALGGRVHMADNEVPTVVGRRIQDTDEIQAFSSPGVGTGRTEVYLETVRQLSQRTDGSPVLGGMIGPFSLAGRLFGLSELLELTAAEPENVMLLLEKTTGFLSRYARAFKEAGAQGVIMAEPSAGLLSPRALENFSSGFIGRIVDEVSDARFEIILHNCAARLPHLAGVLKSRACAFHFGAPMNILEALARVPEDVVVCGNLDPSRVFWGATPDEVATQTRVLLENTNGRRNFVISSGCDIPAETPMTNLEAFFQALHAS
jgi:uroporphyrinogen decarboxylase